MNMDVNTRMTQRHARNSDEGKGVNTETQTSFNQAKCVNGRLLSSLSIAMALTITGCQSLPTQTAQTSNRSHAQMQLFNSSNDAMPASSSALAKSRLHQAIEQHLATEHVSVTQSYSRGRPFIPADSIDSQADSFYKTLFNLFVYRSQKADESYDDSDYGYNDDYGDDYDYEDNYDYDYDYDYEDSYNYDDDYDDSYDYSDYQKALAEAHTTSDGIDRYSDDDSAAAAAAQAAAVAYEYDDSDDYDYDYDEFGGYGDDGYSPYEYGNPVSNSVGKFWAWLADYQAMKQEQQGQVPESIYDVNGTSMLMTMMESMKQTPEQIEAYNYYVYDRLDLNMASRFSPQDRRYQSIASYDFASPTLNVSVQLPFQLDFKDASITFDPAALMPLAAVMDPENTPLPSEIDGQTVRFYLPTELQQQIPTDVIYDAFIKAVGQSIGELDAENFTAVDMRDDAFAQQLGASHAVKAHFGSKQAGEFLGSLVKIMAHQLKDDIDTHPERYRSHSRLKAMLDEWSLYKDGFQTRDVGKLLQLIEAIVPISFSQVNYYYLDASGQLIGKQNMISLGSDFLDSTYDTVTQTRYDRGSFNNSALAKQLLATFDTSTPVIDGNNWVQRKSDAEDLQLQATKARWGYEDDSGYDDEQDDEPDNKRDREKWLNEQMGDKDDGISDVMSDDDN